MSRRSYRRYDPRLKILVAASETSLNFVATGFQNLPSGSGERIDTKSFSKVSELSLSSSDLINESIALKSQLLAKKTTPVFS